MFDKRNVYDMFENRLQDFERQGQSSVPVKKCISFPSTHIIIVSFQSDWKAVDLRVVVIFHLILNTAKNL